MKHGHRFFIGTLVTMVLAVALALLAAGGQGARAAGTIIFVDSDAVTGGNNGSSWADAFTTLQPALNAAGSGDQIWVAEGTYNPTVEHGGTGSRYRSFQMKNGVAIYGGFDPPVDDAWAERDWVSNVTTLSGDIGILDDTSDNSYHVFYHPSGTNLNSTAILDGFTITGGNADGADPHHSGGGMYSEDSSPTLDNVTFEGNSASQDGGGMYNVRSTAELTGCTFSTNSAGTRGGGMYNNDDSSPTLIDCTFAGNSATHGGAMSNQSSSSPALNGCTFSGNWAMGWGGGILNELASSPVLTGCTFEGNSAGNNGGGMASISGSSPVLEGCAFEANSAVLDGGGMFNWDTAPTLSDVTFSSNEASYGGGMANSDVSMTLADCAFAGNSVTLDGGGMYNRDSSLILINCSFAGNSAIRSGGAMFNEGLPTPTVINGTFAGNSASLGGGLYNEASSPVLINCILWGSSPDQIYDDASSSPAITYSDVQGGYPGTGNIDADPLFVNASGGDYHLGTGSPCIDAGNNSAPNLPLRDFEGDPRILDGDGDGTAIVDMGVDEVWGPSPPVIYVDQDATGTNNGTSWADAFLELQSALDVAGTDYQIWVAEGTYKPTVPHGGTGDRYKSFQMMNNVAIYGGFDPPVDDTWEERDWVNNATILSGDLNGDDGPDFANNDENSFHVFYHGMGMALDNSAILDGFTISGGNANSGVDTTSHGGGMLNEGSSPALSNVIFKDNWAWIGGGGMANRFYSSPMLTDCTFEQNGTAWDGKGGGMFNYNGSSPMLASVTFEGNWATYGGGMANYSSAAPTLTGCTFSNNFTLLGYGGGMENRELSAPVLDNCTFTGNTSSRGAGMHNYDRSSPTLTNCTFEANQSTQEGGGMSNYGLSSPTLTNVNFEGNSAGNYAGGMYNLIDSSPMLTDCTFSTNSAGIRGGGMYNRLSAEPTLMGCTFTGNLAGEDGGGMYNEDSSPSLDNCAFARNLADNSGGAMYNEVSAPALRECTFLSNSANSGAGIYNNAAWPTLAGCTFEGNSATSGGGMYNFNFSAPMLTNCTFEGNLADLRGGGMLNDISFPMLTECTFSNNDSASIGGGMSNIDTSAPLLINSTFQGNSASVGGGIHNDGLSSPELTNCTFWGNDAGSGGGIFDEWSSPVLANCILWGNSPDQIYDDANSSPVVTYSDIQGGYAGTGNIDADPEFLNPFAGNFHLGSDSFCIDAGNNAAPDLPDLDFEGDPRIQDGDGDGTAIVDMGVDEVRGPPPPVIYVDQDATGTNSGTSWADAFTDLQDALSWAEEGVEIWVAEGTYRPSVRHGGTSDRFKSFQMVNGAAIYGGFDPTDNDVNWEDRDWVQNVTILSGDLNGDDGPDFANNDENSYHVFFHHWDMILDSSAVLDGFTITGGNANLAPDDELNNRGGGMGNFGSSPTVANCTFSGNAASYRGGGMFNNIASPVVTNCTFSGNRAGKEGGGMSNWASSPTVTGCTFDGNSAYLYGGGMRNAEGSAPTLIDCTFLNNEADDWGGGMVNLDGAVPVLINCTFGGNSSYSGGGVYNLDSSPVLTNCTFWGNSATSGGGMLSDATSAPAVTNCVLWGDTAGGLPSEIVGGSPVVSYSDVEGGYPGTDNIDADPLLLDPANGDFHLSPGSPCIDAGNNAAQNLPDFDFEGDERILDGDGDLTAIVDMGVDEVASTAPRFRLHLPLVLRNH